MAKGSQRRRTQTRAVAPPDPVVAKKTGEHAQKKYAPKAKTYAAGSNALDREKRGKYKDSFKTRADDPRNWEFHYDKKKSVGRGRSGGKGADQNRQSESKFAGSKRYAERQAKRTGQDIYDIREIQYNTAGIKSDTKQAGVDAKAKGAGRFGSTKVAQNLQAQKNVATRRGGGGAGPFDAAKPKKRGMG
jgi:hypothetical protein